METGAWRTSRKADRRAPATKRAEKPFTVSAPQIALPKGGGAISGMGEKFAANPVTGTGSLTVPIALSPGRSGFGPQLSLSYDSGAGNGPFGLGWSLSLPSITRRTDKGLPQYDDAGESDVFILSGAEDLVPVLVENRRRLAARSDPARRICRLALSAADRRPVCTHRALDAAVSDGDTYWRSMSRDNVTTFYGKAAASRITDPADPRNVFSWLISESRDDKGNAILYEYASEDSANIDLSHRPRAQPNRSGPGREPIPEARQIRQYRADVGAAGPVATGLVV